MREPIRALRRSARSLAATPDARAERLALRRASISWSTPRRALRDPRSFRAVTGPR